MRYDQIRAHVSAHFKGLLQSFRAKLASDGPPEELNRSALDNTVGLFRDDQDLWLSASFGDEDGMLKSIYRTQSIQLPLEGRPKQLMVSEMRKGYDQYYSAVMSHLADLNTIEIDNRGSFQQPEKTQVGLVSAATETHHDLVEVKKR